MPTVSMRQLLEAGVHFGHQTRRWNPKMKPYIFAERNGIHIIDLAQTVKGLDVALAAVSETVARGEQVLFVGTKKQAQEPVAQEAARAGQPWINKRWLGGMLTNFHDDQEAHRAHGAARGASGQRRLRADVEEGSRQAPGGAHQADRDPRRDPQDEASARPHLRRRPAPRADRRHRGEQARDPARRDRRHERRPGRARPTSSPATTTPSARSASSARWWPRPPSRVAGSGPPGRRWSPSRRSSRPPSRRSRRKRRPTRSSAALAGGAALTFEPDADDDDLLPGARAAAAAVAVADPVVEATPDEIAAEMAREAGERIRGR